MAHSSTVNLKLVFIFARQLSGVESSIQFYFLTVICQGKIVTASKNAPLLEDYKKMYYSKYLTVSNIRNHKH